MDILLNHGANVEFEGKIKATALTPRRLRGHEETVEILLARLSSSCEIKLPKGALRTAVSMGNWKIVDLLLRFGMDPNPREMGNEDLGDSMTTSLCKHVKMTSRRQRRFCYAAERIPTAVGATAHRDLLSNLPLYGGCSLRCVRLLLSRGRSQP